MEVPSDRHVTDGNMANPELAPGTGRSPDSVSAAIVTAVTSTTANAPQKRKASSPNPTEDAPMKSPKRIKIDSDKEDDEQQAPSQAVKRTGADRQAMARLEETRRGRRLFGGLMNTLSEASAGPQPHKRQDVERRKQAKSTQQRAREERFRVQRFYQLEEVRKSEQVRFDREIMKAKHADMLAKAHFLQTRAQPKIFYLPWKLSRAQEDTIRDQIQEVENIIQMEILKLNERNECNERKAGSLATPGVAVKFPTPANSPTSEKTATVGRPENGPFVDKCQPDSRHDSTTNRRSSRAANEVGLEKESDRVDDVMIEEDEDIVIY
ncbi:hypothetical protein GGR50DRAFT_451140 [Xylaria sp. CBS 124048]|nr:hypothetical protein GGR50DRAFT_451140 [Xylaria sp. CBS 124048]